MCEEVIIDECSLISIAPDGMTWACRRIFDHSDLETLLQQFPQMRLHAHVCEHATENHSMNTTLPMLEYEIVRLWPKDFVGTHNDCLSVLDEGLESV